MTDADARAKPEFPLIDILRGFAAFTVLVYHVIEHGRWRSFPIEFPLVWFRIGWLGVDIFLVISGFVISLSAFALLDQLAWRDFAATFARHRLSRITPLYYLTGLVFIAVIEPSIVRASDFPADLFAHAVFVHNFFPAFHGSIDGQNWSIGLEMQFYALITLAAPWLRRCPIWQIMLVGIAISWSWRLASFEWLPLHANGGPLPRFFATSQLPGTLDEFGTGVLLARCIRSEPGRHVLALAGRAPWGLPAIAGLAIWATLALYWPRAGYWDSAMMVVFWRTACAAACGLTVFALCTPVHAMVGRLTAPLRYTGTVSYGIYLWHLPVILLLLRIDGLTHLELLGGTCVATLGLAAVSWHAFERPMLRWLRAAPTRPLRAIP